MSDKRNDTSGLPWHVWGCMAIAFTIPFAKKLVPGFIVLLGLYAVIFSLRTRKFHIRKHHIPLIALTLIFLLHLIGLSYSEHLDDGINETGIKLSYLAFPLIAWMIPSINSNGFKKILHAFVMGALMFIPIAIGCGIYRTFEYNDASYLSYELLGNYLHPTYAATYEAFALFILLRNASLHELLLRKKWVHYSVCGIIVVFICMLASKAGLIAALISLAMAGWCFWKNKIAVAAAFTIPIAGVCLMIMTSALLPGAAERVEDAVSDIDAATVALPEQDPLNIPAAHSSTELRLVTWSAAWSVLQENFFGVGTGDTTPELVKKYEGQNETYAAERNLNAHNQFLQVGAEHGWPSLLLLIACLGSLAFYAMKWKDILLMNFLLLCGMNFLFESFLEVQAGIVFFCFWVMVFLKKDPTSQSVDLRR